MNKLKILLVENAGYQSQALQRNVFDRDYFDVRLQGDAEHAWAEAQNHSFDAVFTDLNLEDNRVSYDGIRLADKLRQAYSDLVVVIYSSSIKEGAETEFAHYQRCRQVGADEVFSVEKLLSMPPSAMDRWIKDAIADRRDRARSLQEIKFAPDLATAGVQDLFGEELLERLVRQASSGMQSIEVRALGAGYSGAAILRVKGTIGDAGSAVHRILKVSLSQFGLSDELRRIPQPGTYFANRSTVPEHKVFTAGNISGVVMNEVMGRELLRDFLLRDPTAAEVDIVAGAVINQVLLPSAQDSHPFGGGEAHQSDYVLKPAAVAMLSDIIEQACQWTKVITSKDITAVQKVRTYVADVLANGHGAFHLHGRHAAMLHGDLHCRNVFVSSAPSVSPTVIDFGRSSVFPRLFDFAALDTDILISVQDSKCGADLAFSGVNQWYRSAVDNFPFKAKPVVPRSKNAALRFREHILAAMTSRLSTVTMAEYADVLVFQLLRYLRFPTISPARKILACRLIATLVDQLRAVPLQGARDV